MNAILSWFGKVDLAKAKKNWYQKVKNWQNFKPGLTQCRKVGLYMRMSQKAFYAEGLIDRNGLKWKRPIIGRFTLKPTGKVPIRLKIRPFLSRIYCSSSAIR